MDKMKGEAQTRTLANGLTDKAAGGFRSEYIDARKRRKGMKIEATATTVKEIMGGTPGEVLAKAGLAVFAAFWGNMETVGMAALLYFVLLLFDSIMGAAIAMRANVGFSAKKFLRGMAFKFIFTVMVMSSTAIVDVLIPKVEWLSDSPIFYSATAIIGVSAIIDIVRKFGTLGNSKIANALEAMLGKHLPKP
jgi:hypothetical protein